MAYWIGGSNVFGAWLWNNFTKLCPNNSCADGLYGNWFGNNPNGEEKRSAINIMMIDEICKNTPYQNMLGMWLDEDISKQRNYICLKSKYQLKQLACTKFTCLILTFL